MTDKPLRCRLRLMRMRLWRRQNQLTQRMRRRIVLGAFLVLLLAYGWFLFRGMPMWEIVSIQKLDLKP